MLDLGSTFIQAVERSPDAQALVADGKKLTYEQWFELITAVAGSLKSMGIQHGDRIAVIMQNRWEMATIHWACQLIGVVNTPLNWRLKAEEIDYCLQDSGAVAVFYDDSCLEELSKSKKTPSLLAVAVGDGLKGHRSFSELLHNDSFNGTPEASAEDFSLMLYTSGTTGNPKGVPRRHRHERAGAVAHVAQNLYALNEVTLGVMPLYHTMGVRSLLSMALIDGTFVCLPRFDAGAALSLIESEKISCLYLIPTLYHDILAHPDFPHADISSVKKLGFAGAPMSAALLQRLDEIFAPELFVNHYGSTEIYTFSINQNARLKPGSSGRASLNSRLRVIKLGSKNPDELAAVGEEGEIIAHLSSDEAFEGYWKRPDADLSALIDGWYFTGDVGFFDEDKDLFVTGRVDDMIISGGENISPVDTESVLSLHPSVDEVAVVGLEDPRWGQKVVAFLTLKAPVTFEELDEHCQASQLANFKRPREYVFIEEIPKSAVGKILRRKLVAGEYTVISKGNKEELTVSGESDC